MRAGLIALCALLVPAAVSGCPAPPHTHSGFRMESYANLPGCPGQWPACDAIGITAAWYELPTDRYAHGVLGDAIEGGRLAAYYTPVTEDEVVSSCGDKHASLDDWHVFEDTQPRLADLNGDGQAEIIVVRSHMQKGAQLAIYGASSEKVALELIATTPYIGQRNRWLAPLGAADLDGDGRVELAYVDRPHLAKTLRVWRFEDGALVPLASLPGVTNHRIGERDIAGGIRQCDGAPEMIVASADWQKLLAVRYTAGAFRTIEIGTDTSRGAFADAMRCK